MPNILRSLFQDHPFHLVSPSPWPLYTSISLLNLATSTALSMHNFYNGYNLNIISLILVISSMSFWFRDIISEGIAKSFYRLNIAKAIPSEEINKALIDYKNTSNLAVYTNKEYLGYYLAGLLEGDGHLSLPSIGNTTLNRILNPRIVFTSHVNNLGMYAFIQSELGNIGRFQISGNTIRYIIGDIKGILYFIHLIHGKLRTPKNKRLNDVIEFLNAKYSLSISQSLLDKSSFKDNSWFTGFTEADGHFGIRYRERLEKSDTRKRSRSESISLLFRLDQRAFDESTSTCMKPFMNDLAWFLSCNVNSYTVKNKEVLSLHVSAIDNLKLILDYFNKYPLMGNKLNDFKKWEIVYNMIKSKEHLTAEGRLKVIIWMNDKKE
jgi:hypothetical protein